MNAWFQLKTRAVCLFGIALVLVGLLLVLQCVALLLWQYIVALEARAWPPLPARLLFADHSQLGGTAAAPILQFIPELQWTLISTPKNSPGMHTVATWVLDRVHIGLVPALLGAPIILLGGIVSLQQINRLAAAKRRKEDRLRRLREYRTAVDQEGLGGADGTRTRDPRRDRPVF
jgi:hypothetical protein